jgi:ABC-type transport system substrate-binding protein
MRRKTLLSAVFTSLGVVMLVAAIFASTATSASRPAAKPTSKHALKGGTLRLNEHDSDFEFIDPGLAYDTLAWSMLYTTQMLLVNFPEKNGQAGSVLYPEAAAAFPTVSNNGKTYTFHIRPGLKFSDGSAVTAAAYQRAWERNLSPKMGSPVGLNDHFQYVIVGAKAFRCVIRTRPSQKPCALLVGLVKLLLERIDSCLVIGCSQPSEDLLEL